MDWPDWSGETVVVVGTGPSAKDEPLELVRGRARVFAIKSSWRLAPWADALYGIDRGWWLANRGAEGFGGLKFSPSPTITNIYRDVRLVKLKMGERLRREPVGTVACGLKTGGGHSGFQVINLAVQFGAKRILLVGFDMTMSNGAHWHNDYRGVGKPDADRIESWRKAMDDGAAQFAEIGIDVVNCTMASALKNYRKQPLADSIGKIAA